MTGSIGTGRSLTGKKINKAGINPRPADDLDIARMNTASEALEYGNPSIAIAAVTRLQKDLRKGLLLDAGAARYLVDLYYQLQNYRIRAASQGRDQKKAGEPNAITGWAFDQFELMEKEIAKVLGDYAKTSKLGRWALSIHGIGPVIAAGLLAHIDISRCNYASSIVRFGGLDPTLVWEKKTKRPFNADLKVLLWKCGQSFMIQGAKETNFYGNIYRQRKALEVERNEKGLFAEQAKEKLEKYKIGKDTDAYAYYSSGKLPPAHIDARARRYAVKIFAHHFFEVGYFYLNNEKAPDPWIIAHGGHKDKIHPPNFSYPV